jgi:hypothetical protein
VLTASDTIIADLDTLVATLRLERDSHLAAILYHQLHRAAWASRSELFSELSRLLRNTQISQVSMHSVATRAQIDTILSAIDKLR